VAGLFWLKPAPTVSAPTRQRRGAARAFAPAQAGAFVLENGRVRVEVRRACTVTLAGKPVTASALRSDAGAPRPTCCRWAR
jgi:hypothetical protein